MFSYLLEHSRYLNIVGIFVILGICYLFSKNRKAIDYRLIVHAMVMQFLIALAVLKTSFGSMILQKIAYFVTKVYQFADKGAAFIFGDLANAGGQWGFIFAIKVLPVIIFFGALTAVLFYWGVIQRVVKGINYFVQPLLGTTGPETLCAITNSFLGQTEAPLLIRDYLKNMSKSEMLVVMVSGMGTISGAILVVFAAMGVPAPHLLTASVMSIPVTIMIAKMLLPETEKVKDGEVAVHLESSASNVFDAIAGGTIDGLSLALNVGAMLISFVALLGLLNYVLGFGSYKINELFALLGSAFRLPELSLELILGYLCAPFAWLLGFKGDLAIKVGSLLGTKVAVNELIAYQSMVEMNLPERVKDIVTYALCGFSNFSCIGIQIGGIGALVPEKRAWLTELGIYAVLGGALANLLNAMVVSLLI
jgi:CNT family concentrative nucleoside transporter